MMSENDLGIKVPKSELQHHEISSGVVGTIFG